MKPEDKDRKIDDPMLNQDASAYDKSESFEDTDDFHKYDDVANLDPDSPEMKSSERTNEHAKTNTPTFTRTYDKNASDEVDNVGKYDGEIGI